MALTQNSPIEKQKFDVGNNSVLPDKGCLEDYRFSLGLLHPRYWVIWCWSLILWLITRLPHRGIKLCGRYLGRIMYRLWGSRRKIAEKNIALCFPELTELKRATMVKACFEHCGMGILESGMVWWTPFKKFHSLFNVKGLEHLETSHANDKSILCVGLHNTAMEICFSHLSHYIPVNVLFRVNDNPAWEYIAGKGRKRFQIRLLPRKQVKSFLEFMQQGDAGLILPDQDLGKKRSIFVPFFGIQTATVPSVSDFAAQVGAQVHFVNAYRTDTGYEIVISPALTNFPTSDQVADTAFINQLTEEAVRLHPEQYMWIHRRFKNRPPGEAKIY